ISANPTDYLGIILPDDLTQGLAADIQTLSYYQADSERAVGQNTIPTAAFSCLGVTFPVFAVNPITPLSDEPFPDFASE
ncbi:MAG TPA: hypothetical protein VHV52_07680, partial [Gaiellaceae bacterium]|nr:hypothetical protein [Gaiellaceae bacterium]